MVAHVNSHPTLDEPQSFSQGMLTNNNKEQNLDPFHQVVSWSLGALSLVNHKGLYIRTAGDFYTEIWLKGPRRQNKDWKNRGKKQAVAWGIYGMKYS